MRILVATQFVPYPPVEGGRMVAWNHFRGLAGRGHAMEIVVPLRRPEDPANLPHLREHGAVRAVPVAARPLARAAVAALLRGRSLRVERHAFAAVAAETERALAGPFDLVLLHSLFTAYLAPVVRRVRPDTPVVLVEENVESQVFRRFVTHSSRPVLHLGSLWERPRIEAFERRAARAVDRVLLLSGEDAATLEALEPDARTAVCGPGIRTFAGEKIPPPPDTETVLFLGSYGWPPNVDAARWMARSVWPLVRAEAPRARLVLAGADPAGRLADLADPGARVETPGFVPDAVRTVRDAALVVAPLRVGGGVRLKILEALANERPLVTTTLGAEGLPLANGRHASVADDEGTFAREIVRLLSDREAAMRLARDGRALVEERFSWDAAIDRLEGILQEVVAA